MENIATKLVEIASGWWNYAEGSAYTKGLMEKRLAICDGCPHKTQITKLGKVLVQLVNSEETCLFQCGLCGCPLTALTSNPESRCKDGRWLPVSEDSYF